MENRPSYSIGEAYGKVACERSWKWNRSDHPFQDYDLWYVWRGEGRLVLNGEERRLGAQDCYLFRPGDRVDAWHDPDHPLVVTYIHFHNIGGPPDSLSSLPSSCRLDSPSPFEAYLDRYVHVLTFREHRCEEEAVMLLKLLLMHVERESLPIEQESPRVRSPHYETMARIAASIRENPAGAGSIAELAKQAFLSPRYFSSKFKETMGQTVESYIIDKKIERAELLLSQHGMTVGEVADALGYPNIYYFSKQFKKTRGYSPSKAIRPRVKDYYKQRPHND
ncbi:AraC family transcriptional regulator [Paenibacillus sp. PL2-23]|uniref:helix-turn-helix transcriptional regulator n=1 Tax=Paenibacillus sp. PL2-23 TaxID=2100729 RepID=UPI0030FCA304